MGSTHQPRADVQSAGRMSELTPAFVARGVTKTYPGVQALRGIDLEGYPGEVLAICGANGAGKSTFVRLLAGQETPTSGEIHMDGHDLPIRDPADAERAGVLLMHQEPLIIDDFTVGENVWLYALRSGRDVRPWSRVRTTSDDETRAALAHIGLGAVSPNHLARGLAPGQRQMLALSRAVVTPHRILILDETTASTTEAYFESVREMVAAEKRAGTAVVFVSHRMQEVFSLADRIAVFRNGSLVDVLNATTTNEDEITKLMIGEAIKALHRPPPTTSATGRPSSTSTTSRAARPPASLSVCGAGKSSASTGWSAAGARPWRARSPVNNPCAAAASRSMGGRSGCTRPAPRFAMASPT